MTKYSLKIGVSSSRHLNSHGLKINEFWTAGEILDGDILVPLCSGIKGWHCFVSITKVPGMLLRFVKKENQIY